MTRSPQDLSREQPKASARDRAAQKRQLRQQQEKLLSDLLTVVDALDRAEAHWQQAEKNHQAILKFAAQPLPQWKRWWKRWQQWVGIAAPPASKTADVVTNAKEGIELIRASMLSVLSEHQVVPLSATGQPFDPTVMHALGQEVDAIAPPNTVLQEVVRGYRWKDRTLREAQVIVAKAPTENNHPKESIS
ncbi:MAG: nucleotide exchange factor GrpE [Phormidesmis sp.]